MAKENLLYVSVGGNQVYLDLLDNFLTSLSKTSNLSNIDICIFSPSSFIAGFRPISDIQVNYHHVNPLILKQSNKIIKIKNDNVELNYENMTHSIQKIRIFTLPQLLLYKKIIYMDVDIVMCRDINILYEEIKDKKYLYVCRDSDNFSDHDTLYYNTTKYSDDVLQRISERNILPFSGGIFGFMPSEVMQYHFKYIFNAIMKCETDFFYEQSHMNNYFNKNCLSMEVYSEKIITPLSKNPFCKEKTVGIHYAASHIEAAQKLKFLQNFYNTNVSSQI
jgi:lipopolysaccharide biosynthesis glycosyltransferase